MEKQRPMGVAIISAINLLIGLYYIQKTLFWFFSGGIHTPKLILYLFCSLTVIWIGILTWRLRPLAIITNIVFAVIGTAAILRTYILLSRQKAYADKTFILFLLCFLVVLYFIGVITYLLFPKIKEQLR